MSMQGEANYRIYEINQEINLTRFTEIISL